MPERVLEDLEHGKSVQPAGHRCGCILRDQRDTVIHSPGRFRFSVLARTVAPRNCKNTERKHGPPPAISDSDRGTGPISIQNDILGLDLAQSTDHHLGQESS